MCLGELDPCKPGPYWCNKCHTKPALITLGYLCEDCHTADIERIARLFDQETEVHDAS